MARRYGTFTPARRAALRRAQLASAARRRGSSQAVQASRGRRVAKYTAIGLGTAAVVGAGYGAHYASPKQQFIRGHVRQGARVRAESRAKYGMGPKGTYHLHQKPGQSIASFEKQRQKQQRSSGARLYRTHKTDIRAGLKSQRLGRAAQRRHVQRAMHGRPIASFHPQKALPRSRGYYG